jgi:hypothetical protein
MLQLRIPKIGSLISIMRRRRHHSIRMTATRSSDTSLRAGFPTQPKMSAEEEASSAALTSADIRVIQRSLTVPFAASTEPLLPVPGAYVCSFDNSIMRFRQQC